MIWQPPKPAAPAVALHFTNHKMKRTIYILMIALLAGGCSRAENNDVKEKSPLSDDQMALLRRVNESFQYVGTERDSIAAANVLGAIDSLVQSTPGGDTDMMKVALLLRARRFDQARGYAKSIEYAKKFDVPGLDNYINLHIDLMEYSAKGNDKALKATANKMYDYLKKEVASPEFEMGNILSYELSDNKKRAARLSQLDMLKAIAVYFKGSSESAKLASWLDKTYPEIQYSELLTHMPDRKQAEWTIFSAVPF